LEQDVTILLGERRGKEGKSSWIAMHAHTQLIGNFNNLQAEFKEELIGSHLPVTLTKLEKQATLNGSEKGWIVGENVRVTMGLNFAFSKCYVCLFR
jgi:hypothetical protein